MSTTPAEINGHVLNWHPSPREWGDWRCNLCGERFVEPAQAANLARCAGWRDLKADPLAAPRDLFR